MNDDFQIRKDIDRIKWFISKLEYELSGIGIEGLEELFAEYNQGNDSTTDALSDDLNVLNEDLTTLQTSLIEFNQSLLTFNGDTENLSSDLSRLSDNLDTFLDHVNTLGGDTTILSDTLTALSGYLTGFSGTLAQFKQELEDNNVDISALSEDLINVIYYVNTAQTDIGTVQSDISQVQTDMYGSNKDPEHPQTGSVIDNIDVAQTDITTVKGDALELQEQIYGEDGQGTYDVAHPSSGSLLGQTDTIVNTDIPNVKTKMGYNAIGDDSLQSQIVTLFNQLWGFVGTCHVVASESDKNSTYCKKYCKYVYVQATGKYYENTGEDILGG